MNDKTDTEEKPLVRIEGLDHIVLRCARLEATMAFYIDVLGCTLERSVLEADLWQLRAGGSLIDLVPVGSALAGPKAPDPDRANIAHFCLRIDRPNWEDLEAGLASQGIALIAPPAIRYGAQGFGRSIYLADPEGNIVELKANRTSLADEDQG